MEGVHERKTGTSAGLIRTQRVSDTRWNLKRDSSDLTPGGAGEDSQAHSQLETEGHGFKGSSRCYSLPLASPPRHGCV